MVYRENLMADAEEWAAKLFASRIRLLKKEYEKEWEKQQRGGEQERAIQNLTRSELTELCRRLLQEGVITEPEQFAMAVRQGR